MGHLNVILARVGGNLNNNFQKRQMPGGLPGGAMLKLRFDRYISAQYPPASDVLIFIHQFTMGVIAREVIIACMLFRMLARFS